MTLFRRVKNRKIATAVAILSIVMLLVAPLSSVRAQNAAPNLDDVSTATTQATSAGAAGATGAAGGALACAAAGLVFGGPIGSLLGVLACAAAGGALAAGTTYATGYDFVGKALGAIPQAIITFIGSIILALLNALVSLFAWAVFLFAGYNNFINNPIVVMGWKAVRDVANLFFIFILLLIAFSTILGSEKLNYKQHLGKLVLMALFINFSKMITGILIDFSQVVLFSFLNAIGTKGPGSLLYLSNHVKQGFGALGDVQLGFFDATLAVIVNILFSAITAIVFIVMTAMFAARIIVLWILIILSPMAFLLSTIPQGQQYSGRWWGELGKNLAAGPVLAFFLWLALAINISDGFFVNDTNLSNENIATIKKNIDGGASGITLGIAERGSLTSVISFVISMSFLLLGLKMAGESGAVGAGAATAAAGFVQNRGKDVLKAGERALARGDLGKIFGGKNTALGRKVGEYTRFLAPEVIKKGWAGRTERQEHKAYTEAAGEFEDLLNKRFNMRLGTKAYGLGGAIEKVTGKKLTEAGETTFEGKIARGALASEEAKRFKDAKLTADQIAKFRIESTDEWEIRGLDMIIVEQNLQDNVTATARMEIKERQERGEKVPDHILQAASGVSREQEYSDADIKAQQQAAATAKATGKPVPPVWKKGDQQINMDTFYRSWKQDAPGTEKNLLKAGVTRDQMQRLKAHAESGNKDFQVEDFRNKRHIGKDVSNVEVERRMKKEKVEIEPITIPATFGKNAPIEKEKQHQAPAGAWAKVAKLFQPAQAPVPESAHPVAPPTGEIPVPPPVAGVVPKPAPTVEKKEGGEGGEAAGGAPVEPKEPKGGGDGGKAGGKGEKGEKGKDGKTEKGGGQIDISAIVSAIQAGAEKQHEGLTALANNVQVLASGLENLKVPPGPGAEGIKRAMEDVSAKATRQANAAEAAKRLLGGIGGTPPPTPGTQPASPAGGGTPPTV